MKQLCYICLTVAFNFLFALNTYAGVSLVCLDDWSNIYGGKPIALRYKLQRDESFVGSLEWRLSLNERTLKRGKFHIDTKYEKTNEYDILVNIPEVTYGNIIKLNLMVSLYENINKVEIDTHRKTFWVFDSHPLQSHTECLRQTNIYVFDPFDKTKHFLKNNQLKVISIDSVEGLFHIQNSIIVIGEGTIFKNHRGLCSGIYHAIISGNSILCIGCSEGSLELTPSTPSFVEPTQIKFINSDIIESFDKRIDKTVWYPGKNFIKTSVSIDCLRTFTYLKLKNGTEDWPWVAIDYEKNKGRLIVCGFGIIENAHKSAAAPYLLAKILTEMKEKIRVKNR